MPTAEFLLLVDRMRSAERGHASPLTRIQIGAGIAFSPDGLAYRPGDQVIDLLSGQKGVVLAGERHTVIVSTAGGKTA